ncbi:uncharacterized protein LOC121991389 [Zingiber officinale]|uniref:uncharacterized protein LOC121991389 n=1 Tax=Zingiber officinale TaxID=94328 RepID=UPI001C4BBFFA|nr:uncharacterized protein LOC121991389 [Zingiber officinale]
MTIEDTGGLRENSSRISPELSIVTPAQSITTRKSNTRPPAIVTPAESSLPRDSKKGKVIVVREEPRELLEELQVPFSLRVLNEKLLKGYKPLAIGEYDDGKDPEDHLHKFRNVAMLHQYSDAIKCRVFLNTLSGSSQKWFDRLPVGSITYFQDFKNNFMHHFASSRKYQKTNHCLFALRQGPAEPLRAYIKRFNQVVQDVPSATSEILMSAFSHSMVEREFFRALIQERMKNFDEMLGKAASYMNDFRPVRNPGRRNESKLFKPPDLVSGAPIIAPTISLTPIPKESASSLPEILSGQPNWAYLRPRSHPKVQKLLASPPIAAEHSSKSLSESGGRETQQPNRGKEPVESPEEENRRNVTIRKIDMISGRPTDEDSTRARKFHECRLKIHVVGCS